MPKGDLINRDALKEEVVKLCERINANNGITVPTLAFTRIIDNAPTVELTELCKGCQYLKDCETCDKNERPQGEWISLKLFRDTYLACNKCRKAVFGVMYYDFCPNCGARMKGGAE